MDDNELDLPGRLEARALADEGAAGAEIDEVHQLLVLVRAEAGIRRIELGHDVARGELEPQVGVAVGALVVALGADRDERLVRPQGPLPPLRGFSY